MAFAPQYYEIAHNGLLVKVLRECTKNRLKVRSNN